MSASRRRRGHSSRASGRLALGLLLGELIGASAGVVAGARRHAESNVEIAAPRADYVSGQSRLSAAARPDGSDDDTADPLVTWPLLGLAVGAIVGVGAAAGTLSPSDAPADHDRRATRTPSSEARDR